jgi:hypothetical protein
MSGLVGRRCQVREYEDDRFVPLYDAVVQGVFPASGYEDAPTLLIERVESGDLSGELHVVELEDVIMVQDPPAELISNA